MITRFRRWLARLIDDLFSSEPAGGVVTDRQFAIDDGVNYDLPLVLPEWATEEQRAQLVQAAVREASSAYHFQFDRPYLYSENLSLYPTADPLKEWSFQTRREVLARCHMAWERNPLANAAVGLTTLFAVGSGMTVTYKNKDVEAVLEEFRKAPDNGVEEYEKSFCDALQVDGEVFVRFHELEGQTVITVIPPWEIDWIQSERGFHKRPLVYHQLGSQSDGTPGDQEQIDDPIPADEIMHTVINKLPYEARGRPDLFRILPWLKAYKDWLEGRARQNHWRGALLWDVTLTGATPQQVINKRAQYKQPPPPGSLTIHNDKETWQPLESKVGAADVSEDGRQIKLMSAVGARLPEYMLSDGENANLASATAQQLPALRKFTDFQDILVGQVWKPIYRRVIENAIIAGILQEEVEEQDEDGEPVYEELEPEPGEAPVPLATAPILQAVGANGNSDNGDADEPLLPPPPMFAPPMKRGKKKKLLAVDAFDVRGPELESDDPKTLAEALQIATDREWVSDETASGEMGFDYGMEQKKIKRGYRKDQDMQAQGLKPGPFPAPGSSGLADFQSNGKEPARESEPLPLASVVEFTPPPVTVNVVNVPKNGTQATNSNRANDHAPETLDEYLTGMSQWVEGEVDRTRTETLASEAAQALLKVNEIGARVDDIHGRLETALQPITSSLSELVGQGQERDVALAENTGHLTKLASQVEKRDRAILANVKSLLRERDPDGTAHTIPIDEAMLERVATLAAEKAVGDVETLIQEITGRDNAGRPTRFKRITASGRTIEYQINRDSSGNMTGFSRKE